MIEVLDEIKRESAIHVIYDYISIINEKIKLKRNKKEIEELKKLRKQLLSEIRGVYQGDENLVNNAINEYSKIIKKYYEEEE